MDEIKRTIKMPGLNLYVIKKKNLISTQFINFLENNFTAS